jgi:putative transposase
MRRAGLKGVQKRRFVCTTRSGAHERWAPDLVERHFAADRPNALWLADVTYVATLEGFLYLAVVLDVFSRLRQSTGAGGVGNGLRAAPPAQGDP